jgi:hypothetical protein
MKKALFLLLSICLFSCKGNPGKDSTVLMKERQIAIDSIMFYLGNEMYLLTGGSIGIDSLVWNERGFTTTLSTNELIDNDLPVVLRHPINYTLENMNSVLADEFQVIVQDFDTKQVDYYHQRIKYWMLVYMGAEKKHLDP